jgi:16S rRNA (uracil1498-N3)-methyltransferase
MQFVYDQKACQNSLSITDENYRYLFKARRLKVGDIVKFRNLLDDILYSYEIKEVNKKEAILHLKNKDKILNIDRKTLHLIWCIIDSKVIYATLPMLNQIGLSKITFLYCDRSQKNFKLDLSKIEKILINSCQQCGRVDLMEIEVMGTLDDVLQKYDNFSVLDFGGESLDESISSILIGCEGGFSQQEREKLSEFNKIGLKTEMILKSETATLSIASKLLI